MFGFSIRTGRQNATGSPSSKTGSPASAGSTGSPKTEVGEIDTRAPFQSVRAAVSLFGDAGSSPKNKPAIKRSKTIEEVCYACKCYVVHTDVDSGFSFLELDEFISQSLSISMR